MSEQKRRQFLDSMFGFLDQGQITQRDDQLRVIAELGGLDVLPDHRDGIDDATLHRIVTKLAHLAKSAHETDNPTKAMSEAMTEVLASWVNSSKDDQ